MSFTSIPLLIEWIPALADLADLLGRSRRSFELALGLLAAGERARDAPDPAAHPVALVADVVRLREVGRAAGAGECQRAQEQRQLDALGDVPDPRDALDQASPCQP